jgi:hypothetical protein
MGTKTRQGTQFGVCIDNSGYAASLEVGKLYRVIADEEASKHGYIRVVDESGEDYGYSVERFFVLKVPQLVAHALSGRSRKRARRPNRALQPTAQTAGRAAERLNR